MKVKVFLFLFFACTLLAGRASAQGCSAEPLPFPHPNDPDRPVNSGTCIANVNVDPDAPGQAARLRWDEPTSFGSSHYLALYDTDEGGFLLWCPRQAFNGLCWRGLLLCLQQDGNMVIYKGDTQAGTPHCGDVGSNPTLGNALWASNTQDSNDGHEELLVDEDVVFRTGEIRSGERAVIRNGLEVRWTSAGYSD